MQHAYCYSDFIATSNEQSTRQHIHIPIQNLLQHGYFKCVSKIKVFFHEITAFQLKSEANAEKITQLFPIQAGFSKW